MGPVPRSNVVALSSSADVEEGTLVWKDGMEDWQPYYSVFPRRVVKRQHKVAEVGALLMMIAGWLWVTALTTMTLTLVLSLGREKMISLTFFIPGILGLANLILLVVGKSMLLTAPAGHGVRGSLITALAFSVAHVFLLTFVLTDFSDPVPTRLGSQSGLTATSWIPIVSTLPFASLTGTTMIYEKSVTNTLVLLLLLGWLEIGRLVSTLFAMRALSMTCRSHSGVMMSLSTLIVLAVVVFVTNLALISVAQHIQTTILDQNFDADISMRKIILWAFFSVYGLSIVIAMLYGLSMTFTYSAMKKAKL